MSETPRIGIRPATQRSDPTRAAGTYQRVFKPIIDVAISHVPHPAGRRDPCLPGSGHSSERRQRAVNPRRPFSTKLESARDCDFVIAKTPHRDVDLGSVHAPADLELDTPGFTAKDKAEQL